MAREGIDIIHSDGTTETWYATSVNAGTEVDPNPTMSGTETTLDGIGIDGTNYNITDVVANPTLAGTESTLTGIEIDGTKYKNVSVVANPTLAGTEASLTGLEVDGTKYAVGGSVGHRYIHYCSVAYGSWGFNFEWINDSAEATAINPLIYIQTSLNNYFPVCGYYNENNVQYSIFGLLSYNNNVYLRCAKPDSSSSVDKEIRSAYISQYQFQQVRQII